ncbi:hypothetical protein C8R44DRAFT_741975 [Mycena epipterygia]|nr:hypothetical protein C8R44DRAFT_741975 [Mycena epipterygia]
MRATSPSPPEFHLLQKQGLGRTQLDIQAYDFWVGWKDVPVTQKAIKITKFHEFPSKSRTFSFLSEVTKSRRRRRLSDNDGPRIVRRQDQDRAVCIVHGIHIPWAGIKDDAETARINPRVNRPRDTPSTIANLIETRDRGSSDPPLRVATTPLRSWRVTTPAFLDSPQCHIYHIDTLLIIK